MTTTNQTSFYFEDLREAVTVVSPARTITEADVVAFAGLSGDYNPLHIDAETAARSTFGRRIAHGLLGTSVASGLFTSTQFSMQLQDSLIALLDLEWRFVAPIFIGDTIHVEATIIHTRSTKNPSRGIGTLQRVVRNQDGKVVQSGTTQMLFRRRTDAIPDAATNGHHEREP